MKSFKQFLSEAYSIFPKSENDIVSQFSSNWSESKVAELTAIFNYLKKRYPSIETPINIDIKKSKINVSRELQGDVDLAEIKKDLGLKELTMKFGNGSSGNRGANNRGNAFEGQWAEEMRKWWDGEESSGPIADSVEDVANTYDLYSTNNLSINVVGGENTRRPLSFSGNSIILENPKGSGFDVGASVTDITLETDFGPIYLSLKLGGTTTFFNVGVRTILTPQEIKENDIRNKNGLTLLKTFGIDPDRFCKVFNQEDIPKSERIDTSPKFDKKKIETLLQSGIGYGYHIIHKMGKKVLSKKMDKSAMEKAAKLTDITVYYGGLTGTGRRIDVVFESSTYSFKINIRDTQGKDGYPTRMMCDFKYK